MAGSRSLKLSVSGPLAKNRVAAMDGAISTGRGSGRFLASPPAIYVVRKKFVFVRKKDFDAPATVIDAMSWVGRNYFVVRNRAACVFEVIGKGDGDRESPQSHARDLDCRGFPPLTEKTRRMTDFESIHAPLSHGLLRRG